MRKYWYRRILIMIATFTVAVGGSYYLIRDFKEQMKQEVSADTAGTQMVIPGGMPIGIYLETSRIIYYGIDKENCKPEITALAYSSEKGCYERRPEAQVLTRDAFQKEIEKEALFLEKNLQ